MKRILITFILFVLIQSNFFYSQVQYKTPYEKKKEEIAIKFLKKMGVSINEINNAKNADPSGLLLLLLIGEKVQIYEYTHGLEVLVLTSQLEKELQNAKKLKNKEDFRREQLKIKKEQDKENEKNEKFKQQQLIEEWQTKQRIINEEKEAEKEAEIQLIKDSDVELLKSEISNSFVEWAKKGEFETSNEYSNRMNSKQNIIDSLCFFCINDLIKTRFNANGNSQDYYSLDLNSYNADEKLYYVQLTLNRGWDTQEDLSVVSLDDTIQIDIPQAKKIMSNNDFQIFSSDLDQWIVNEKGYLFPKSYLLLNGEIKREMFKSFKTADKITFSSTDLKLNQYFSEEYISNNSKYLNILLIKKRNKIIVEAEKQLKNGDLQEALNFYFKANALKESDKINRKIKEIQNQINELKAVELVKKATQFNLDGQISKSIITYEEVEKLGTSINVTSKIKDLQKELYESKNYHKKLDSLYELSLINYSHVFRDVVKHEDLANIKSKYVDKYELCKNLIIKNLNTDLREIQKKYNDLNSNRNREVFDSISRDLLNQITIFQTKVKNYSYFEERINNAIINHDKKYLKILKNDDPNTIIESVIRLN
jgi:hypothetical protein